MFRMQTTIEIDRFSPAKHVVFNTVCVGLMHGSAKYNAFVIVSQVALLNPKPIAAPDIPQPLFVCILLSLFTAPSRT
eukprot:m.359050 g.359050  ORF g.359050 m.359050 type:complete len:77 (+) comp18384_c0_seq1:867-1097(+)